MKRLFACLIFLPFIASAQLISPSEFESEIRQQPNSILLDLRNLETYMEGHIRKSVFVDLLRDDFKEYILSKYKPATPILIYGQTGTESENAYQYLKDIGYQNIKALAGGFEAWVKSSKPYKSIQGSAKPLQTISPENYREIIKSNNWVIVVFADNNCTSCTQLYDNLKPLSEENSKISIYRINLEVNTQLNERLKIYRYPTVLYYKGGIQYWKSGEETSVQSVKHNIF